MKNFGIAFLALASLTPVTFLACAGGSDTAPGGGGVGGVGGFGGGATTTITTNPTSSSSSGTTGSTTTTPTGTACPTSCTSDADCQNGCPPVASGANCCDTTIGICYIGTASTCPTGGTGGTGGVPQY